MAGGVGAGLTTDWLNIGGDAKTKNDQPDRRFIGSLRLSDMIGSL